MSEKILMKKSRFTEAQIMGVLRRVEGGLAVPELCREHGISNATFYKWRAKYGGMDASIISQMKALEDENRRLKRIYADLSMQADLLKEALEKKEYEQMPCGHLDTKTKFPSLTQFPGPAVNLISSTKECADHEAHRLTKNDANCPIENLVAKFKINIEIN